MPKKIVAHNTKSPDFIAKSGLCRENQAVRGPLDFFIRKNSICAVIFPLPVGFVGHRTKSPLDPPIQGAFCIPSF